MVDHPRVLRDIASEIKAEPVVHKFLTGRAIIELAANPLVEGRWDAIRDLLTLTPPGEASRIAFQPSHSAAIALLPKLAQKDRLTSFGLMLRVRYDDTPFMSAKDLFAALPHFPAGKTGRTRAIVSYLRRMDAQLIRLQPSWERERGTSPDAVRSLAAEQLRTVEELAAVPESVEYHAYLLAAYGATRCSPADAQRQWEWLLRNCKPVPTWITHHALAAARDYDTLKRTMDDIRPAIPLSRQGKSYTDSVFVEHLVRLGRVDDAEKAITARDYPPNGAWAIHAQKGTEPQGDLSNGELGRNMTRARMFLDAGFDFESVIWMLSRNSPYYELLQGRRARAATTRPSRTLLPAT